MGDTREIDSFYGSYTYFRFQVIGITSSLQFLCKHVDGVEFVADLFVGCALPLMEGGHVTKEYCESFIGKRFEGEGFRSGTWLASEGLKEILEASNDI